jgi:uncharacterized membrane protein
MLPYLIGLSTLVGGIRPYIRKHILDGVDPSDYLFINSLCITAFILVYFGYLCVYDKYSITKTVDKCCSLSYTQIAAVILLAGFTVLSSMMLFSLEKYFNTPAMNHMMLKAVSLVMLFVVGVIVFNENYSLIHMAGIGLTLVGVILLMMNPVTAKVR